MNVVVNGEAVEIDHGTCVDALVDARVESPKGIAVAVNAEVVPRSTWSSHLLADGDRVELLTAAQGG